MSRTHQHSGDAPPSLEPAVALPRPQRIKHDSHSARRWQHRTGTVDFEAVAENYIACPLVFCQLMYCMITDDPHTNKPVNETIAGIRICQSICLGYQQSGAVEEVFSAMIPPYM
ncbi:hypothetical protein [Nocardia sp. GTS18]|uniref:hypothetical protein n=1 Tax=Nocardia sp. GTS18 TaxID=1778064 RepID=UPI0015EF8F82|nr:hypothetical protein [Nocardia sp. GTS18]